MPVTLLELENFKSYAGFQQIGPFHDFTSVIGPNGSGKSNLMDAISFVLGVQSRDLRSSQMKDLIYRPGAINGKAPPKNQNLRCCATLVYEDNDGEEIRFSRSISPAGVGDYKVDGKSCNFAAYEKKLSEIGVLVKARNFLVFQGDVESLARKSPTELVALFENISGSADYKEEYDAALIAKEEAEAARLFASKQKKGFESERHQLKDQKEEAERFHDLLETKASLQTDLYMWLLYHLDQDRIEREAAAEELATELEEHVGVEEEAAENLKAAKKSASAARRKTAAADKHRVQFAAKVDQLEPSIIKTTEEIKNLQKKLKQDETALAKKTKEAETHEDKLAGLDQEIVEYRQTEKDLVAEYEETKKELLPEGEAVHLTAEQEDEYERVREAAAAASAEPRRVLASLNRKLESARSNAATLSTDLSEAKERQTQTKSDIKECSDRIEKVSEVCGKRDRSCVVCPPIFSFHLFPSVISHKPFSIYVTIGLGKDYGRLGVHGKGTG